MYNYPRVRILDQYVDYSLRFCETAIPLRPRTPDSDIRRIRRIHLVLAVEGKKNLRPVVPDGAERCGSSNAKESLFFFQKKSQNPEPHHRLDLLATHAILPLHLAITAYLDSSNSQVSSSRAAICRTTPFLPKTHNTTQPTSMQWKNSFESFESCSSNRR